MVRCWVSLLLLGTVSASVYKFNRPLGYALVRKHAVQQYNIESRPPFLFQEKSATRMNTWDPHSSQILAFSLKIKETVCRGNPQTVNINSCDFKPDGVTKSCLGGYKYKAGVQIAEIRFKCKTK